MSILRRLYPLIRRCPRPLIQGVYRVMEAADPLGRLVARSRLGYRQPLPPMRLRRRVGTAGVHPFVDAGARCAEALRRAIRAHDGRNVGEFTRVLDFGCGCGRTLQHFYFEAQAPVFEGCDVDPQAIDWMRRHYDAQRFHLTHENPPLPFPDAAFDLIYLVSVFTHLTETHHLAWLRELRRVLKPGGVLAPTIQSQHALDMFVGGQVYCTADMHRRLSAHSRVEHERFIFEPYETQAPGRGDYVGIRNTYGLTFIDTPYIREHWTAAGFDLQGIDVGSVDGLQDVVVLRTR